MKFIFWKSKPQEQPEIKPRKPREPEIVTLNRVTVEFTVFQSFKIQSVFEPHAVGRISDYRFARIDGTQALVSSMRTWANDGWALIGGKHVIHIRDLVSATIIKSEPVEFKL